MSKLLSLQQDIPLINALVSSTDVNPTYSNPVDLGSSEGPCSMQLDWFNGSSPTITVSLEFSNNKIKWVEKPTSVQTISTVDGAGFWTDIFSGEEFVRVKIVATSGSAVFSAYWNGKQRLN